MLSIDWLSLTPIDVKPVFLERWIFSCLSNEKFGFGEIALIICTDDELLEINVRHLNHDYYTDIITFDYSEGDEISGDLFVSLDRVRDNAGSLNINFIDELHRVIIHGVMHLCGYGDKSDDEVVQMRKKEDFYLEKREGFT